MINVDILSTHRIERISIPSGQSTNAHALLNYVKSTQGLQGCPLLTLVFGKSKFHMNPNDDWSWIVPQTDFATQELMSRDDLGIGIAMDDGASEFPL